MSVMKSRNMSTKPSRSSSPLLTDTLWQEAVDRRTVRVGIVGMGYVGLPLMRTFCRAGFSCLGFDVDTAKVDQLNAGKSYITHYPVSVDHSAPHIKIEPSVPIGVVASVSKGFLQPVMAW